MQLSNDKFCAAIDGQGAVSLTMNNGLNPTLTIEFETTELWDMIFAKAKASSRFNRQAIEASSWCGCFHCLALIRPELIEEWVDRSMTGCCPECGVDALIADKSGFLSEHAFGDPWTDYFLRQMQERYRDDAADRRKKRTAMTEKKKKVRQTRQAERDEAKEEAEKENEEERDCDATSIEQRRRSDWAIGE